MATGCKNKGGIMFRGIKGVKMGADCVKWRPNVGITVELA